MTGAFRILSPTGVVAPLVAHVPHASAHIPSTARAELVLSDDELAEELLRLTDWYTDELFAGLRDQGLTMFVNRLSRLVFDPERFLDEAAEPMAPRGQGVVYWRGTQGQELRHVDPELRARRIDELYRPYHAALDALVAEMLTRSGTCTVIDCHSFPSVPLPSEIDQGPDRPEICIGTDKRHSPPDLVSAMEAAFAGEGFRVRRDTPFAGTFVPGGYYGRDARVRSVMIEVRRGLYMDESTGERLLAFDSVRGAITRAVSMVVGHGLPGHESPRGPLAR